MIDSTFFNGLHNAHTSLTPQLTAHSREPTATVGKKPLTVENLFPREHRRTCLPNAVPRAARPGVCAHSAFEDEKRALRLSEPPKAQEMRSRPKADPITQCTVCHVGEEKLRNGH